MSTQDRLSSTLKGARLSHEENQSRDTTMSGSSSDFSLSSSATSLSYPPNSPQIIPDLTRMGASGSKASTKLAIDNNVQLLRQLYSQFHFTCWTCGDVLRVDDLDAIWGSWLMGSQVIPPTCQISSLQCKNGHTTCAGCGKAPKFSQYNIFTNLGVVNHCCPSGRLFGVWFLLSRFDEEELQSISTAKEGPKKSNKKHKPLGVTSGPGASVSPGLTIHGVGYAGEYYDDDLPWYPSQFSASAMTDDPQIVQDKSKYDLIKETLKMMMAFMPDNKATSLEELALFRISFLFDRIADLIDDNSIFSIIDRHEVYVQTLVFLEAVAHHPVLVQLLEESRPRKLQSPGTRQLVVPMKGLSSMSRGLEDGELPPISSIFPKVYEDLNAYLAVLNRNKRVDKMSVKHTQEVSRIYNRIDQVYGLLKERDDKPQFKTKGISVDSWMAFQAEHRVEFTDNVLTLHRYKSAMNFVASSTIKGRLNTISKEIATMTTSLPPGVFVKVAESRIDAMKVLIVGPEGTPYAGGLFIFDLLLDANYPNSPPKMSFVLDGNDNDEYSFNPNLHKGGTVCLSILNTWSGAPHEMWQPNKTTLLAVLVSIQGMILGAPIPWVNEPGHGHETNTDRAHSHKLAMQHKTLRYAMIGWLEKQKAWNADSKEYIWRHIVEKHFKHNGSKILETVKDWAKESPELLNVVAKKPKQPKKKAPKKGKNKVEPNVPEPEPEPEVEPQGENLVERLALLLGLAEPAEEIIDIPGTSTTQGKRNAKFSNFFGSIPKKLKMEDGTGSNTLVEKWVYTRDKTQKEVRAACKEFGIGAASTIKDSVTKLEKHVNGKGKANQELAVKWGETLFAEAD